MFLYALNFHFRVANGVKSKALGEPLKGCEFFLYLLLAVFWFIACILKKKNKKLHKDLFFRMTVVCNL